MTNELDIIFEKIMSGEYQPIEPTFLEKHPTLELVGIFGLGVVGMSPSIFVAVSHFLGWW